MQSEEFKKLHETFLETIDEDITKSCKIMHAIKCYIEPHRSTKGKLIYANDKQINNCRKYVFEEIKKAQPKLIYAVGITAMKSLFGHIWKDKFGDSIERWQGFVIPHRDLNAWVIPIYNTKHVIDMTQNNYAKQVETIWEADIVNGLNYYNKKVPTNDYYKQIELLTKTKDIDWCLEKFILEPPEELSFDYETNALKARGKDKKLICISICDGDKSYAFPIPTEKHLKDKLVIVLTNPKTKYIAHNMKFERSWSKIHLGIENIDFIYDPCIGMHYLDNRSGITGLKFQTFAFFGIGDYSSHTKTFIKGQGKKEPYNDSLGWEKYTSGNSLNKMEEFPIRENLEYCALDSLFTFMLYKKHQELFDITKLPETAFKGLYGYDLLHKGTLALGQVEDNGFRVDVNYLQKTMDELICRKAKMQKELFNTPFVREWKRYYGESFNLDSGYQLGKYLFEVKNYKCLSYTEKGGYSTDAEALIKLNLPELNELVAYKKVDKVLTTFLKGLWFERNDDVLHCNFNSHLTVSYRLSSNGINLQNIPKHDEEQMLLIRKALIPYEGHYLLDIDYKSLEVFGALAYTHCPTTKNYLMNPKADQHKDSAVDLFCNFSYTTNEKDIDEYRKLISKENRQTAKNGYVFPSQYGSYWGTTATDLWERIETQKLKNGELIKDHLENNGIKTFEEWQAHVKKVDELIWQGKFAIQYNWQKSNYKEYQERGYFDSYSGFRYRGYMKKNNVNNYSIQGFCSNIVLYCIVKINRFIKKNKLNSKIISTVHDSIIFSIDSTENKVILPYIEYICNRGCYKHFPYFDVPSPIEFEVGEIGDSWDMIKPIKYEELLNKY